jgi:hypothetical protein
MGRRKLQNDLEIDNAYISNNEKLIFFIIDISGRDVVFRSFDNSDGSYISTKQWSEGYFMDRIKREATPGEIRKLDSKAAEDAEKEVAAEWKRREQVSLADISTLALILEVQRRGLVEDILSGVASEDQFLAAARRRGFDLMKKEE